MGKFAQRIMLSSLLILCAGCTPDEWDSKNLEEERVESPMVAKNYAEPGEKFTVVSQPDDSPVQRVVLQPKETSGVRGPISALVIPPKTVEVGSEVEVERIDYWSTGTTQTTILIVK